LKDESTIDAIFPELSPSIMPQISPEFTPANAIEISQSPELRFSRSHSPEIDPKFIFIKSPGQILEQNSNKLSQNQTQSMFDEIVGRSNSPEKILNGEAFQKRTIATLCLLPEDSPSMSQDPTRLSIFQRVSSRIKCGLLDPLERKPSENRLRPGIKGGSKIAKCATMVPTSIAAEVAMRINAQETGQRVCHF
jgi:hypothetical protein